MKIKMSAFQTGAKKLKKSHSRREVSLNCLWILKSQGVQWSLQYYKSLKAHTSWKIWTSETQLTKMAQNEQHVWFQQTFSQYSNWMTKLMRTILKRSQWLQCIIKSMKQIILFLNPFIASKHYINVFRSLLEWGDATICIALIKTSQAESACTQISPTPCNTFS